MKKLILAAALLAASTTTQAASFDGNLLKEDADAYRGKYPQVEKIIAGGEFMVAVMGVGQSLDLLGMTCSPAHTIMKQDFQIVINYLDAHPEQWAAPAAGLIRSALIQAYPCAQPMAEQASTPSPTSDAAIAKYMQSIGYPLIDTYQPPGR